jgi:hypothetical protein
VEGPIFVNRFRESQSECIGSLGNGVKKIARFFAQRWERFGSLAMFAAAQIQCGKISRGLFLDTPRRREAAGQPTAGSPLVLIADLINQIF